MDIDLKEVQVFGLVSMFLGASVFLFTCLWDTIAGVQVTHHEGIGLGQFIVLAASGLYTIWAWSVHYKWREYRKMIHGAE